MAGVVVVEGLCGVNEPDPMQLLVVVMLWLLGVGDFWGGGGGVGGDLGYPVPVAASAIERIFAVGIEGWMGVPPMTSTRKAC